MSILLLFLAIFAEVAGTTCLKLSGGFSKLIPSLLVIAFYGLTFALLSFALKRLDVSTVYATWSGVGTALIAVVGIFWFKEPFTALKITSLLLIILGVVGLNLAGAH